MSAPENTAAHPAVTAWLKCPAADDWPHCIDRLITATWQGIAIGWPLYQGESFEIYRLEDSTVVTEEDLPTEQALALEWKSIQMPGPLAWQS